MSLSTFKNKTVLITGASAGVGAACARHFAHAGANLALVARGEAALHAIAEELRELTQVLTITADVTEISSCQH
ncbi:MAG: SDR family NAD(P)-dependent oxidoreductase, partial [Cellvibrionales bacterium]|nr:SDR family NAD(P)-dependent oxidoreductase [Cellvibrionales bacterium]